MTTAAPSVRLRGRRQEMAVLRALLDGVRRRRSGALVVRGEPGIGKTSLLEAALARTEGVRIVRVGGVESEMELAFAGLHQLLRPLLEFLPRLPEPQAEALSAAFGLRAHGSPDRFLVGRAVLGLLAEAVVMLFVVREPRTELAGLPELELGGLPARAARALLASVIGARLDERVSE